MKKIIAIVLSMLVGFSACEFIDTEQENGEGTEVTPGGSEGDGTGNEGGENGESGNGNEGTGEGDEGGDSGSD